MVVVIVIGVAGSLVVVYESKVVVVIFAIAVVVIVIGVTGSLVVVVIGDLLKDFCLSIFPFFPVSLV